MTATDRAPLSRQLVADTAVRFIDEHGLEALSMRKLGAELDVEAMSLYNHVASKEDLLGEVGNAIYAEILEAYGQADEGWRENARRMAHAYRDAAERHPNAVPVLIDRPVTSHEGLEFLARIVSIFQGLTDDMEKAALAFQIAGSWVIGMIIQEHGLIRRLSEGEGPTAENVPPEFLPLVQFKTACVDTMTPAERFAEGLETVLDGLDARFRTPAG